jgi:hypothetical protein
MRHRFDYYSGWCHFGCGNRDDGRITSWNGSVIASGPSYTEDELTEFRERQERRKSHA